MEMDRQAKFPASAAGRLFNVFEIFSIFFVAHRAEAKEIHTDTYVLSQCSFSTIISQCFSVLSSVFYDQYSVCTSYAARISSSEEG